MSFPSARTIDFLIIVEGTNGPKNAQTTLYSVTGTTLQKPYSVARKPVDTSVIWTRQRKVDPQTHPCSFQVDIDARIDIRDALHQLPTDATLQGERADIDVLRTLPASELRKWLQNYPNQTLKDVFGIDSEEELDRIGEELREKEMKGVA